MYEVWDEGRIIYISNNYAKALEYFWSTKGGMMITYNSELK